MLKINIGHYYRFTNDTAFEKYGILKGVERCEDYHRSGHGFGLYSRRANSTFSQGTGSYYSVGIVELTKDELVEYTLRGY